MHCITAHRVTQATGRDAPFSTHASCRALLMLTFSVGHFFFFGRPDQTPTLPRQKMCDTLMTLFGRCHFSKLTRHFFFVRGRRPVQKIFALPLSWPTSHDSIFFRCHFFSPGSSLLHVRSQARRVCFDLSRFLLRIASLVVASPVVTSLVEHCHLLFMPGHCHSQDIQATSLDDLTPLQFCFMLHHLLKFVSRFITS